MRHEIFWQRGKAIGARDKLAGSCSANVVIIGGGVAGLTVADELVRPVSAEPEQWAQLRLHHSRE